MVGRLKTTERIPQDVFLDPRVDIDMEKNIVYAADGRVWTDVVIGPWEEAERRDRGEYGGDLEAWGVRVQN